MGTLGFSDINFSGLMNGEKNTNQSVDGGNTVSNINFKGLMDTPAIKPQMNEDDAGFVSRIIEAPEKVAKLIADRGTLLDQFTMASSPGGLAKNIIGVIAAPFQSLESGLSNPVIEMQRGNFNPIDLISESAKGFAGIKRGEFGDTLRQIGAGDKTSALVGLGLSFIVPLGLAKLGSRIADVTQFADSKIIKSVSNFTQRVQGAKKAPIYGGTISKLKEFARKMKYGEGAMNKVGGKVGAYYDDIGEVFANKAQFSDELSNMTTAVKKSVADMPAGKLAEVEEQLAELTFKSSVNDVHTAKEIVDDLINGYFTSTSKAQKLLRKSSKNLGKIIDKAVYDFKVAQIGKRGAQKYLRNFQKARKNYSELKNGYASIQRKLINPQTGEPTQTGQILKEITDPRNIDLRATLKNLNRFGTGSKKFAHDLDEINKSIMFREFTGSALKSAGRGLVIGATAGQILKRSSRDTGDFVRGKQ